MTWLGHNAMILLSRRAVIEHLFLLVLAMGLRAVAVALASLVGWIVFLLLYHGQLSRIGRGMQLPEPRGAAWN